VKIYKLDCGSKHCIFCIEKKGIRNENNCSCLKKMEIGSEDLIILKKKIELTYKNLYKKYKRFKNKNSIIENELS
jgi:hypothetical protein